ncbi:twin-arginine translocase TatA/TatE family subunit [Nocardioides sp. GY 10113]|uniref:twin-arginine translocase TatA/TatE family subunit n=1 Tax=Nocardioides sp. GY 10113 TaxID=2569761 RepID=UPI0010A7FBD4|nr:twin-arginine translocase TatA/TatE family subunit [Nocardioides sp. GY 10113]TIC87680.1 twin-arginine translocase TatA/TatE family subunit [Nocardioides sp. GY 10113]
MSHPLISAPGTPELLIILAIVILVFGAAKLPDLARGTGQALRIFKAETRGLRDDEEKAKDALPSSEEPAEGEIVEDHRRDTSAG